MIFKGYNGFPDLQTFDMINTGVTLGEMYETTNPTLALTNCFRAVNEGTCIEWDNILQNNPLMEQIALIRYSTPNTWIKAYPNVYICNYSHQTEHNYNFTFRFVDYDTQTCAGDNPTYHYDYCDTIISVNDNFTILGQRVKPKTAILFFDRIYNPYESAVGYGEVGQKYYRWVCDELACVCANAGSTNVGTYLPKQYGFDPDTQTVTTYAWVLGEISGDLPETWCCYSCYGSVTNQTYLKDFGSQYIVQGDDYSGAGGGGGDYGTETSYVIPSDGVPNISAISSGFVKIYHPSHADLMQLKTFLYSSSFLDSVVKLISDPLDYIISLMLFPCEPLDGNDASIGVGGVDSEITSKLLLSQYREFDCGSIDIQEKYGAFLDYDNFTRVSVYLPFCGMVKLDTNLVMHSTIRLRYAVDFLTGDCVAKLYVKNNHGVNAETYFKEGNCACQIPMDSKNYMSFYTGAVRAIMGAGSALGGNPAGLAQSAQSIASMHIDRERVGGISGNAGFLSNYTPYLVVERPVQSYPENYNHVNGRPANIGGVVSSFNGYTEIKEIDLNGVVATETELNEIRALLGNGVYI